MYGADHERLLAGAAEMRRAADELERSQSLVHRVLIGAAWFGQVAVNFTSMWNGQHRRSLMTTSAFIREAAATLERQAIEQRDASAAGNDSSARPTARSRRLGDLDSRSSRSFESRGSGRADIVEAFYATGDGRRAEGDEIEIRRLDNGRYIIVLPGVVDLSEKLDDVGANAFRGDAVAPWYEGDQPNTVRRMAYAVSEARDGDDSFQNPYALRVIEQMQRAGIPAGADVMLIGHSFGAYTAMELAGNEKFNSASGVSEGYHVNVTHVVAVGADTDWKMAELPDATNSLILNNRKDLAFRVEDPLRPDLAPRHEGQVEIEFFGRSDRQAAASLGHSPDIYAEWLSAADDRPELNRWLDDAGSKYSSGGMAYSVKVPDFEGSDN
jgi:hypothetical protein